MTRRKEICGSRRIARFYAGMCILFSPKSSKRQPREFRRESPRTSRSEITSQRSLAFAKWRTSVIEQVAERRTRSERKRRNSSRHDFARTYIAAGGNASLSFVRFLSDYRCERRVIWDEWREHARPLTGQPAKERGLPRTGVGVTLSWRPARSSPSAGSDRGPQSRFSATARFFPRKNRSAS